MWNIRFHDLSHWIRTVKSRTTVFNCFAVVFSTHHTFLRNENYKTDTLNRIETTTKSTVNWVVSVFWLKIPRSAVFFLVRNCKWIHRLKNRSKSSSLHLTSNAFFSHVIFFSFILCVVAHFFSCSSHSFASWLFIESNEA